MADGNRRPQSQGNDQRGRGAERWASAVFAVLAVYLLGPPAPCRAQQWWWNLVVGLEQRGRDTQRDGAEIASYDSASFRVSYDVHGFVIDPLIGNFTLGLDLALTQLDIARERDTERVGLRLDMELFPTGAYSPRFYFQRQAFDHTAPDKRNLIGLSLPEETTRYGATLWIRNRGPLRGTFIGFDRTEYEFLEPQVEAQRYDRQYVDWSRSGRRLRQQARLERRENMYGTLGLESEDYTLNVEQRGDPRSTWRWVASLYALERELRSRSRASVSSENVLLRTQLSRDLRSSDQLDLRYSLNSGDTSAGPSTLGHDASGFYRLRALPGLEIAPFVGYATISGGTVEVRAPRVGVAVYWNRAGRLFETQLNGEVALNRFDRTRDGFETSSESSSGRISATLGHGRNGRLFKQLELQIARNELRVDDETSRDLDDLLLPETIRGTRDLLRGRLSLSRRQGALPFSSWVEWLREEASGSVPLARAVSETLRGVVQVTRGRWRLRGDGGRSDVTRELTGDAVIRFASGGVHWRPVRSLRLYSNYRYDRRDSFLVRSAEGERLEVGLRWEIGDLRVVGQVWRQDRESPGLPETSYEGFGLVIERGFVGWLPIGNGSRRRGVVR